MNNELINAWKSKGVTKEFIVRSLSGHTKAIEKASSKLNNTQLMPRKELMEKILRLWK